VEYSGWCNDRKDRKDRTVREHARIDRESVLIRPRGEADSPEEGPVGHPGGGEEDVDAAVQLVLVTRHDLALRTLVTSRAKRWVRNQPRIAVWTGLMSLFPGAGTARMVSKPLGTCSGGRTCAASGSLRL
jgi:hypothetical protein